MKKKPATSCSSRAQNSSPLHIKLNLIKAELDKIKPETLLLNVDPSIEASQIIEQIQAYHNMIHKEMISLTHQEAEQKELEEINAKLTKNVEELVKPPNINYLDEKNRRSASTEKNKPVIDYQVKIRSLEKDIVFTYQHYNQTKSKNETLMKELNELRKMVIANTNKLNELKSKLQVHEEEFYSQKEKIEKNIENKEETDLFDQIKKNQKVLAENNQAMIQKIKDTDKYMTQKLAAKKFLEYEKVKLEEKQEILIKKSKQEIEDFYKENAEAIQKVKSFDRSSKILEMLDEEKIEMLENMLKEMYNETKTANIQSFVQYFIKSSEEYKTFQDFIFSLTSSVNQLESEVEELEYIINFCEQNLQVVNENKLDEDEMKEIQNLKDCSEKFIIIQFNTILEAYKKFSESMMNLLIKHQPELETDEENSQDFMEFFKNHLGKMQEQFRELSETMKVKKASMKNKNSDYFDFSRWDKKWEKSEKIKENVKKEYEKVGQGNARLEFGNIKEMVEDVILKNDRGGNSGNTAGNNPGNK